MAKKQIDANNVHNFNGVDILNGINTTFEIVETTLPGLQRIFEHIAAAVANGPRAKRIKNLESFVGFQQIINKRVLDELTYIRQHAAFKQ